MNPSLLTLLVVGSVGATPPGDEYQEVAYVCSDTTVKATGSRLTDEDGKPEAGSGSSVSFASGLSLVGYETPKVLQRQKPGDKVQVCLVAVPKDCPKGDDRGKVYRVFDYKQKAAYELADSQHSCGGA